MMYASREIAHAWAHALAPSGKCPSNMSFEGERFYSYGTVIAKRLKNSHGVAFVHNRTSYSVSTTRHQYHARRAAVGNGESFDVYLAGRGVQWPLRDRDLGVLIFEQAVKRAADASVSRRAAKAQEEADALDMARRANAYFGLRRKVDDAALERARERQKVADAKLRKAETERRAKAEAEAADRLGRWLRGDCVVFPYAYQHRGAYLRRLEMTAGDVVQTSMGVEVPAIEARKLLRFVRAIRDAGRTWRANGGTYTIGSYQLSSVSAEGIIAGCHRISWAEIERFAATVGW